MIETVRRTVDRHRMLLARDCVLVACSGGADSTALACALHELAPERDLALCLVHLDHGLRPGSAAEGDGVEALGARLGLPVRRAAVEVPGGGGGLQERARTGRYRVLEALADELGCARIAVGHTRSDQAETVLHRLLRGAGLAGIAAIPPVRGRVIRPLLDVPRAEVLRYLAARGEPFAEDPSNERPEFLRTALRHDVLPVLDRLVPGVEERLAALAGDARDLDEALASLLAPWAQPSAIAIAGAPPGVRSLVVRQVLRALRGSLRGIDRSHLEAAVALVVSGPTRGEVHLPGGALVRDGDRLAWDPTRGRGRGSAS